MLNFLLSVLLIEWIVQQHMFWIVIAALQGDGHVNVSPKGTVKFFHVESPTRVWYEDLRGSGVEMIAHMRQPGNGRIIILFNAFEGPPRILCLWGKGTICESATPEYNKYIPPFNHKAGSHAMIVIDVHKVGTSCGSGVPLYKFETQRTMLQRCCDQLEGFDQDGEAQSQVQAPPHTHPCGIKAWWTLENIASFHGLLALRSAHDSSISPIDTFDKKALHPSLGQTKSAEKTAAMVGRPSRV
ncbi:hypothetical protein DFH29DRAFT_853090 [Suillus ampliporus]|nr:hypothetical protein DFH29DRAFT_853090 [Suillus ampliporus]